MSCLGRLFGLLLILLILVVTPCAFWAFNIDRVAMNPDTYKTALKTQQFYTSLLPALVDATAANDESTPQMREAAAALVANLSPEDWAVLSERLLPADWLQSQLERNIDNFFAWISGTRSVPDIKFDLGLLKQKLSSTNAAEAANLIVPNLPICTSAQETQMVSGTDSSVTDDNILLPICAPSDQRAQELSKANLVAVFNTLGSKLPSTWEMKEHLHKGSNSKVSEFDMNRFRAMIWLDSRLIVLIFLVPVALFAIIIMVTIRSAKQMLRWLGWGLILSGLLTLLPIPLVTAPAAFSHFATSPELMQEFGTSGLLVANLVGGMLSSIASGMTLAVLTQVIVAIVVGFVAVFISVLLPSPVEPDVSWHDVARERRVQQSMLSQMAMGSTPRPYAGTAVTPQTPTPQYTPPPAPKTPTVDPLADLFQDAAPTKPPAKSGSMNIAPIDETFIDNLPKPDDQS